MASYSRTPLAMKLGIKAGMSVALADAPDGFESALADLPDDVEVSRGIAVEADVIVAFHTERAALDSSLRALTDALAIDGGLWIAWPKRASKVPTDISEDVVREVFLPIGMVDNKVCAIDETWSGLRLVWRKEQRARLAAARGAAR